MDSHFYIEETEIDNFNTRSFHYNYYEVTSMPKTFGSENLEMINVVTMIKQSEHFIAISIKEMNGTYRRLESKEEMDNLITLRRRAFKLYD